ncbi:MAG: hypothetical protein ABJG68_02675 [Crocinitomicaceae bacterium]
MRILSIFILFASLVSCVGEKVNNYGISEDGTFPLQINTPDGTFDDRDFRYKIQEVHPNGQVAEYRIIFEDTTMIWYFDSTGFQYQTQTNVGTRILSAEFYDSLNISAEYKYIWNDTIPELHWIKEYYKESISEGLADGDGNYIGEWTILYSNDTLEKFDFGNSRINDEIPDSGSVFYLGHLVGYRIKDSSGKLVFHKVEN